MILQSCSDPSVAQRSFRPTSGPGWGAAPSVAGAAWAARRCAAAPEPAAAEARSERAGGGSCRRFEGGGDGLGFGGGFGDGGRDCAAACSFPAAAAASGGGAGAAWDSRAGGWWGADPTAAPPCRLADAGRSSTWWREGGTRSFTRRRIRTSWSGAARVPATPDEASPGPWKQFAARGGRVGGDRRRRAGRGFGGEIVVGGTRKRTKGLRVCARLSPREYAPRPATGKFFDC
jgi:hypothetical protein